MITELDFSLEWKRGIWVRFRQSDKYIETMPTDKSFEAWREGKTNEIQEWRREQKLTKKDIS